MKAAAVDRAKHRQDLVHRESVQVHVAGRAAILEHRGGDSGVVRNTHRRLDGRIGHEMADLALQQAGQQAGVEERVHGLLDGYLTAPCIGICAGSRFRTPSAEHWRSRPVNGPEILGAEFLWAAAEMLFAELQFGEDCSPQAWLARVARLTCRLHGKAIFRTWRSRAAVRLCGAAPWYEGPSS
jgi:hypothetical protein